MNHLLRTLAPFRRPGSRRAALAAVLSGLALAPLQGADWPVFRGDPGLQGVAPGRLSSSLELVWTHETDGPIVSSPVVAEGRAYVGSDDGKLHAVDLRTGAGLWTFASEDLVEAPPLVVDGVVYFGSSDFYFYAVDAESGELRWKHETADKILGGANVLRAGDETRIVVGSYDAQLYCFEARSGALRWTYATDNFINGTPAVWGDRVVFGGCDAVLHVVQGADGKAAGRLELGDACHVAGSVGIGGDRVYFGHYGNEFLCVDLAGQKVVWSYPSPRQAFFSAPAITQDRVLFGGRDKQLHCVDRDTGTPVWTKATGRKVDASPVVCDGKVVFGSGDGRLYLLALEDGQELWSFDLGRPVDSSPAVVSGFVLVGSGDGKLYTFGPPPEPQTSEVR
jgi:outer membrane protein assembly factor BamB